MSTKASARRVGSAYTDRVLFARLLRLVRPQLPHIGGLFALSLLATPLELLVPVPVMIVVDSVVGSHPPPGFVEALVPGANASQNAVLVVAVVMLLVVGLLIQLRELVSTVLSAYTGEKVLLRVRGQLFRHVQRLSLRYHDVRGTADSTYRVQYDASAIQWLAVNAMTVFVTAVFTLVGMVYVTARIDWQLALVALTVVPVLYLVTHLYRLRLRAQWRESKEMESSALSVVQEVLTGLRVVKSFGQEEREQQRFMSESAQGMRSRVRLALVDGAFGVLVGLTTAIGTAAVLYIGVRHVQSGTITLGSLLLVMVYLSELYDPLETISHTTGKLQGNLASAERIFAVLDEPQDVPEAPDARPLTRAHGAVAFRSVSFAYVPGKPVLHEITFDVEPGVRIGIAGTTGSGKTTLISLLTRMYDPTQGAVLLDGVDLRAYRLADLRGQFAVVLQEPVLFSTTIAENISYARPGAERDEIVAAAKAANAHDFVSRVPAGYDTIVGERGMTLSGGERQRISLARAFLRDAPILVLDEPTSSVDLRTEAAVMDAMERLMAGRTSFMIAHRASTLEQCDIHLQIEDGRLAEMTTAARPPVAAAL